MPTMPNVLILCLDDEREVLNTLAEDLKPFEAAFRIKAAGNATEARQAVKEWLGSGGKVGLVLADHLMPGGSGVDFLVELNRQPETASARKVLVTAHADLNETVKAVNASALDHYIAKPWNEEELQEVAKRLLTDFVVEQEEDLLPYVRILDGERIMRTMRSRGSAPA